MGTGGMFLRKVRAKVVEEPTGFVWVEKGKLAASGYPASRGQIKWIVGKGIGSVLTLTPQPIAPESLEGSGLVVRQVPMKDHEPPSYESLKEAVSFIQEQRDAGRPVLVHCLAGEGRTGCALAAYVMTTEGLGPSEALETIRKAKPEFVEWSQEKAVFDFASRAKG